MALLGAAATLSAQQPTDTAARASRAPRDSAARDSVVRDSADTIRVLPAWPGASVSGPLPPGRRLVFDQDAIQLSGAVTLADLLREVPGVYVMRGGFFGQSEPVMYVGRSGVSPALEIRWDGMALDPLGADSIYLDPARVPLGLAERVEITVEPTRLRVDVTTLEHRLTPARSQIRVMTGDDDIAEYRATFEKRWTSGTGIAVGVDYHNIERTGINQAPFSQSSIWLKGAWVPRPTSGIAYEILSSEVTREASPRLRAHHFTRTDAMVRLFARQEADGRGWSLQGLIGSQRVAGDSGVADQTLRQAAVTLGYQHHLGTAELEGRARDARVPFELTARAALRPLDRLVLAGDARRWWYEGHRAATSAHFAATVGLLWGVSARTEVTRVKALQAPALAGDTVQEAIDVAGAIRWDGRWGSLEVGLARRDPWRSVAYPDFRAIVATHNLAPETATFTAWASLRPTSYLILTGWYHDPYRGGADFEPPKHFRGSLAFQSKFWRKFRSGVFTLRGELAAELWSTGIAGRDSLGNQRSFSGATFVESNIEIQIVGATLFYVIRNSNVMRGSFVPGLPYPRNQRVWGVRWVFHN